MSASPDQELFNLVIDQEGESVVARVSDEVMLSLTSEFGSIYDSNNDSTINKAVQLGSRLASERGWIDNSYTMATVQGSQQIWKGSSSSDFSFEIAFITQDDPLKDVREKVKKLYKMVVPFKGGGVEVGGQSLTLISPPKPVSLTIPNVLDLEGYYITSVQFSQSMKLVRQEPGSTPLPMSAKGVISVTPPRMVLRSDIDNIFP